MKNLMSKTRKSDDKPYMVFARPNWTWSVQKSWQGDDRKSGARWFCKVTSPFVGSDGELGDVYVADIVNHAVLVYIDPVLEAAGYTPPKLGETAPNPMDALLGSES